MRLKLKNTSIILLTVLYVPQVFLVSNYALGNTQQINISTEDRNIWLAKSKLFHDYALKLSELGIQLVDRAEDNQIHQDAGECIVNISTAVGLLETVYKLNANCSQTYLTIRDFYLQIIKALAHTTAMTDYNEEKIKELHNKTRDADILRLMGEGSVIIRELQKTVAEQRKYLFSKLRKMKK